MRRVIFALVVGLVAGPWSAGDSGLHTRENPFQGDFAFVSDKPSACAWTSRACIWTA